MLDQKNSEKIPPIVFLITEEDDAVFQWIIENKEQLYTLGYRHINLELNCDESLEPFLKKTAQAELNKNIITKQMPKKILDAEASSWHQTLKHYYFTNGIATVLKMLKDDSRWKYSFIDIKKSEMFKEPYEKGELISSLNDLKIIREKNFSDQIVKSSQVCDGGTITIIGSNHNTVYEHIKKNDSQCATCVLFISASQYYPVLIPLDNQLLLSVEEKRKQSYSHHANNRKENLNKYFPPKQYYGFSIMESKHKPMLNSLILNVLERRIKELNCTRSSQEAHISIL